MSIKANEFADYRYYRIVSDDMRFKSLAFKVLVNHAESKIQFSVAQCSEKDNFDKKIARKLLDDRFNNGGMFTAEYNPHFTLVENCMKHIHRLITDGNSSRQLQQLWNTYILIREVKFFDTVKEYLS